MQSFENGLRARPCHRGQVKPPATACRRDHARTASVGHDDHAFAAKRLCWKMAAVSIRSSRPRQRTTPALRKSASTAASELARLPYAKMRPACLLQMHLP